MESIFLRIRGWDGERRTHTYPLSAFGYISHTARGHLHIVIGDRIWLLAACHSAEMASALEDAILQEVTATILAYRDLSPYQGPSACIIDLNEIADGNLTELARAAAPADTIPEGGA